MAVNKQAKKLVESKMKVQKKIDTIEEEEKTMDEETTPDAKNANAQKRYQGRHKDLDMATVEDKQITFAT